MANLIGWPNLLLKPKGLWFLDRGSTKEVPTLLYNLKMAPCSCPHGVTLILTGASKWCTVWTFTSTGTGIMKGQS